MNSNQVLVFVSNDLLQLIKQAMLKSEVFNRSEFLRQLIERGCNEILKGEK